MSQKPTKSEALIKRLHALPVAILSDSAEAIGLPEAVLRGVSRMRGTRVAGYARTVARELAPSNATQADYGAALGMGTQAVIDSCGPLEIMVIAVRGNRDYAVWGDNMATRASSLGVRAIVTDGAVRDIDEMDSLGMAVFAGGTTPRQAFRRLVTTAINEPVVVGGVRIHPWDIIVADGDGVIAVSASKAEALARHAEDLHGIENTMQDYIRAGHSLVSAVDKFKAR